LRKDDKGRIHLKLVFYGPSLGGKTTALRWLYGSQKRHRHQRKVVLQGTDGILFVADSAPDQRDENMESFEELKLFLGDSLGREVPIVVMLNKRDLPNRMSRDEMLDLLGLGGNVPIYETIAVQGVGVKRAFQAIAREVILKRMYK
jgi:signal recognition particle receptor subunit beta